MSFEIRHLQTMVEVWSRRKQPEGADLQRALYMAEILEGDRHSPTHLRAFAWHLAEETHRTVGWDLPKDVRLSSCRAAAASLSHATSLLKAEIAAEVHGSECPVLLLGALAASRAIFGRWDLLPARGALLVACDPGEMQLPELGVLPTSHGIHWAAPGRLQKVYEPHTLPETLDGEEILIPSPALLAARVTDRALSPREPATLIFCAAAHEASYDGQWPAVTQIAKALGRRYAPLEVAIQLGIDHRLGFRIGNTKRTFLRLRRRLRKSA